MRAARLGATARDAERPPAAAPCSAAAWSTAWMTSSTSIASVCCAGSTAGADAPSMKGTSSTSALTSAWTSSSASSCSRSASCASSSASSAVTSRTRTLTSESSTLCIRSRMVGGLINSGSTLVPSACMTACRSSAWRMNASPVSSKTITGLRPASSPSVARRTVLDTFRAAFTRRITW